MSKPPLRCVKSPQALVSKPPPLWPGREHAMFPLIATSLLAARRSCHCSNEVILFGYFSAVIRARSMSNMICRRVILFRLRAWCPAACRGFSWPPARRRQSGKQAVEPGAAENANIPSACSSPFLRRRACLGGPVRVCAPGGAINSRPRTAGGRQATARRTGSFSPGQGHSR